MSPHERTVQYRAQLCQRGIARSIVGLTESNPDEPGSVLGRLVGSDLRARHRSRDRKSTRLNSSHLVISYAVFCLKKKRHDHTRLIQGLVDFAPPIRHGILSMWRFHIAKVYPQSPGFKALFSTSYCQISVTDD